MQCHEFEQIVEQGVGERLPADAAAHLNECGPCRAMASDLEAIQPQPGNWALKRWSPRCAFGSPCAPNSNPKGLHSPQEAGWSVGLSAVISKRFG
jgi:hypothetical protein